MNRDIDRRIATELLGYEVQVSPLGNLYIHHESKTCPLPDYSTDLTAVESACDAWCAQGRDERGFTVGRLTHQPTFTKYQAELTDDPYIAHFGHGRTMAAALYAALAKAMGIFVAPPP